MSRDELPLSWNPVLLAIIPGFLATVGLVRTGFSIGMLVGLGLFAALVVSAYLWNKRELPSWSLMAVGILVSVGLTIASGAIGGLVLIVAGAAAELFMLFVLWAALIALMVVSLAGRRAPSLAWVLFALIVVCQLAVRAKYFVLFGVSWSVAGQWLNISLYSAAISLLLPVAIGLRLARRHGRLAMLFAIGAIYMDVQLLIDMDHKVSGQIGGTLGFVAYKTPVPLLFTVLAPLWFLRAPSERSRVSGVLGLAGMAVLLDIAIIGLWRSPLRYLDQRHPVYDQRPAHFGIGVPVLSRERKAPNKGMNPTRHFEDFGESPSNLRNAMYPSPCPILTRSV